MQGITGRRAALGGTAGAIVLLTAKNQAASQAGRTTRIVVGFAPGGPSDIVGRLLAEGLRARYAPQAIVENRTGAGGRLAVEQVVSAVPDGSVMLQTPASMVTVFPALYGANLRYDPLSDLLPVTPVCAYSFVLVVNPRHPARDIADLVAWARAQNGLACGNPAAGSMPHFLAVQAGVAFGISVTHVPYRGSAPAVQDVIAGNLPAAMVTLGAVAELQRSGRIRVIAISSAQRPPSFPDMPTFAEQGYGQLTAEEWIGVFVPARTPAGTVSALHGAISAAVTSPGFQAGLTRLDYRALVEPPEAFASRIRAEQAYWAPIVQTSGFRPDD